MTLQDVERISAHQARHPPLRHLVRAIAQAIGIKLPDPNAEKPRPMTEREARLMMRVMDGRIPDGALGD